MSSSSTCVMCYKTRHLKFYFILKNVCSRFNIFSSNFKFRTQNFSMHTANWPNSSEPPQNKIFPVHSSSKTMAAYAKNRLPCKIWASKSAVPARPRAVRSKINNHFLAWFGLADQKFDTKNQFLVESRPKKKKHYQKICLMAKVMPKKQIFLTLVFFSILGELALY